VYKIAQGNIVGPTVTPTGNKKIAREREREREKEREEFTMYINLIYS